MLQPVDVGPQRNGVHRESHGQVVVTECLLEHTQVGILLDRLGRVETQRALSDDYTLANHACGLLHVAVALRADSLDVFDEKCFELRLVLWREVGARLQCRLGSIVKLNLAQQLISKLVIDCRRVRISAKRAARAH